MGGGGGGPTQSQVTQTNLPEYARPYFENLMQRTEEVSQQPYQSYTGPRIAGFTQNQQTGANIVKDIAAKGAPDLETARSAFGGTQDVAQGLAGYQPGTIQSQYQQQGYRPTGYQSQTFGQGAADYYSSPYMQNVVERQQAAANRAYQEGQSARDAQAIRSGAFGGYRNAIEQGVAQRGLQNQLADIQASGSQAAYQQAQAQFNADQAARQQAAQLREQSRQYGSGLGLQSAQYANQAQMEAAKSTEAARQAAAGIQQAGGALGLQAGQAYGSLAGTEQTLGLQRAQAIQGIGQQEQALKQQELETAYTDFMNQRDFPRQQLQFYSSILRGVPVSATSNVSTYTNPNPLNQAMGLGISGLGLYNTMNRGS